MLKKVQLVLVPYVPDTLKSGMYCYDTFEFLDTITQRDVEEFNTPIGRMNLPKHQFVKAHLVCEDIIDEGDCFYHILTKTIFQCSRIGSSGIFTNDETFFSFEDCLKVFIFPEQIGLIWDNHPDDIHDTYLVPFITDTDVSLIEYLIEEQKGHCEIEVDMICPNYNGAHIGKDCSCKSGFKLIPKLVDNKVIMHFS